MLSVLMGWRRVQLARAPASKLILSETATTGDGGCVNISNTFLAGFFWVNQLGLVSAAGYWKAYRQDMVGFSGINGGSSYALAGPPGWVGSGTADSERPGPPRTADGEGSAPPLPAWPTGPLQANPDYFTSLLWKAIMGPTVLNSSLAAAAAPAGPARVYASCSRGGLIDPRVGKICRPMQKNCDVLASHGMAEPWLGLVQGPASRSRG